MKHIATAKRKGFFSPLVESTSLQAAMMTLAPGQSSSETVANEHPRSEQWVFVIRGIGTAKVAKRSVRLTPGSLLLIEKRERHRITNTGRTPMVTINFYAPPAYSPDGDVRVAAKR